MPRTPDRFPGTREESQIRFDGTGPTPTSEGEFAYIADRGLLVHDGDFTRVLAGRFELLLTAEPEQASHTYTPTYVTGKVTKEEWASTEIGTPLVKSIDYTYDGITGRISQEVRKVFGSDGTTVEAQVTVTYSYNLAGQVTGESHTRDI